MRMIYVFFVSMFSLSVAFAGNGSGTMMLGKNTFQSSKKLLLKSELNENELINFRSAISEARRSGLDGYEVVFDLGSANDPSQFAHGVFSEGQWLIKKSSTILDQDPKTLKALDLSKKIKQWAPIQN